MLCDETIVGSDYFALKISRKCRVVLRKSCGEVNEQVEDQRRLRRDARRSKKRLTLNTEISAQKRFLHVDVFDFHLDIIHLSLGLLCPVEAAPGAEKGGG